MKHKEIQYNIVNIKQKIKNPIIYEGLMFIHPITKKMIMLKNNNIDSVVYNVFNGRIDISKPSSKKVVSKSIFRKWYKKYLLLELKRLLDIQNTLN